MNTHRFWTVGRACGLPDEDLGDEILCARAILKLLREKRWTQKDMCAYLGVSPYKLRQIEEKAGAEPIEWRFYRLPDEEAVAA